MNRFTKMYCPKCNSSNIIAFDLNTMFIYYRFEENSKEWENYKSDGDTHIEGTPIGMLCKDCDHEWEIAENFLMKFSEIKIDSENIQ